MTSGRYGLVLREVGRLLGGGTVASLGPGQLLERFAADRDEAAFEALVTRHGPMVLGTCRRMLSDPLDVEDAFQATFLVLARKAGSIQDADRLGPWLHGVAHRVATRSRALSSRRNSVERQGVEEPAAESPDLLEGFEIREALDEELARLPEKYRAPLVLCYLEGLTHDEAAAQLRWPVGTVRSRLAGGRDRLRSALTRRGFAPSAAVPAFLHSISIPPALLSTTVRVATTAGSPSVHVLNLAKGALIAMTWNKFKLIAALGLMVGLTVGGAGVAAQKGGETKAEAKAEAQIIEEQSEPKRGVLKISGLRHVNDQIEELQAERERLKAEQVVIARKLEQIRYDQAKTLPKLEKQAEEVRERIDSVERKWKELAAGVAPKHEEPLKDLEAANEEVERLTNKLRVAQARIALLQDQLETSKADAPAPPTDPAEPKPPITSPLLTAGDKLSPGPSLKVPTLEERKANPRQRPTRSRVTLVGGGNVVLVIPSEQDRATVLNTETGTRVTQRFPQGVSKVLPVVSDGLVALDFKGPEVRQVAVFNIQDGKWYPQDLREPATEATSIVEPDEVTYRVGRFFYVFSVRAKKWGVLELNQDPGPNFQFSPRLGGSQDGKWMVPEGYLIHIYDPKTGEWTHIDTKDDK